MAIGTGATPWLSRGPTDWKQSLAVEGARVRAARCPHQLTPHEAVRLLDTLLASGLSSYSLELATIRAHVLDGLSIREMFDANVLGAALEDMIRAIMDTRATLSYGELEGLIFAYERLYRGNLYLLLNPTTPSNHGTIE